MAARAMIDCLAFLVAAIRRLRAAAVSARDLAWRDPVTGLPGRVEFSRRLAEAIAAVPRGGTAPELVVVDLDRLGELNRRRGRNAGDHALAGWAKALRRFGRTFRLGGDEFALLVDDGRAVDELLAIEGACTLSIGHGRRTEGEDSAAFVARVDAACLAAKAAGGNQAVAAAESAGAAVIPRPPRVRLPRHSPIRLGGRLLRLLRLLVTVLRRWQDAERASRELARRDDLTGCWRRWYGRARVEELLAAGATLAVVRVDVVGLKERNLAGHRTGDESLRRVAELVAGDTRFGDLLCRWEGSAFLLVLPGCDEERGRGVIERLRRRLDDAEPGLAVTLAIAAGRAGESAEELVARVR